MLSKMPDFLVGRKLGNRGSENVTMNDVNFMSKCENCDEVIEGGYTKCYDCYWEDKPHPMAEEDDIWEHS